MHDAEMREADVRWMPFTICAFSPPAAFNKPRNHEQLATGFLRAEQSAELMQSSHFRRSNLLR